MSQVTIELGNEDKNLDVFVDPMEKTLMGRFSARNLGRAHLNDVRSMSTPDVPGWHIRIDVKNGRVKVYHPHYRSPEGDKAEKAFRTKRSQTLNVAPPETFDELSEEQVQRWLLWAYRAVHQKPESATARIVDGEFPKGTKEAVDAERNYDRHLANAHNQIAHERARAAVEAEALAAAGPAH